MKKQVVLASLLFISISLMAQKNKKGDDNIPAFGKVEKADLEMKECDFDPKAEAVVLLDDGQLDYLAQSGLEFKRRVRIKILSDKGLGWADVHLRYWSERNAQDITNIEAQTYNLDPAGNIVVTKVEKKLIYEKKINKKQTEKVFTFPEAKVGSIIEYKFKYERVGLIDWYFQRSIPVKFSRFALDFPSEIEIATIPYCSGKYEKKEVEKYGRLSQIYTMTNEPGFRDEPFIINEDYYRDRLESKLVAYPIYGRRESRIIDWLKVIKSLMEDDDFGVQIKKNIPRTTELDAMLKNMTDPYQKMKTIYKYVQDNMAWNNYFGIWASDGVKSAWKDKKGTVGEINLILVNLLKDADLNAHPVLVSTHDNGVVNTGDAGTYGDPGFNQFDKVMAYVKMNDKVYVLDASQKGTPVHLVPPDVVMTEGMVIEKLETFEWGWQTLWSKDQLSKNIIQTIGVIDEGGIMKGDITITSYDYARLPRVSTAKKGKDKFTEKYLTEPGVNIDEVTFENLESDSLPLVQKIKFNQALNVSGDYRHFSANVLSDLSKNPFVKDSRYSDVFFGTNQSYLILGNFTVPDGYELETLPKNIKMIMPDTSITISRASQFANNTLLTKIQLEFKKSVFSAEEYPELQEFYKQLYALLNEQFVIRKKK
ncbi:MAG: DUF3857 domain-containing protein [Chitinophagaceae bacterium]